MPTGDILDAVRRGPLLPFRLLVSEGTEYTVRHPERPLVGTVSVSVSIPHPDNPYMYTRIEMIDARHIVKLVQDQPAAAQG